MARISASITQRIAALRHGGQAQRIEYALLMGGLLTWWGVPIVAAFAWGGVDWGLIACFAGVALIRSVQRHSERRREDARRDGFRAGRVYGAIEEAEALRQRISRSEPEAPQ